MRKWDSRNASFYKQMDASFMHYMSLPTKFTKNFGGQIGEMVKLKGPSGNKWRVGVTKRAEKFVLRFGWKDFIVANDMKENDILIFKYEGNSSFEVRIFQPNGCERISSFFVKKEWTNLQNLCDCSIQKVNGPERNIHQHEIITYRSSSDYENHTEQSPTKDEKPTQQPKKSVVTSRNKNGGSKREMRQNERPFMYLTHKLHLTTAQNKKALQLTREVQPGNPYFVGVMNSNSVGRDFVLTIPSKFSAAFLPRETQKAALHYKGRIWNAMYIDKKYRKQIGSSGWKSFVTNNNLQEGDIYLFELLKDQNEKISFRVHLSKN